MTLLRELTELLAFGSTDFARDSLPIPADLKTPYKIERLLVGPSDKRGSFDEKAVDVPFVFRHQGRFYMTYLGFEGIGYQTGLASSPDLLNWRKEGVILPRNPRANILRYNAAMTWILRENDVFGPGRLKKIRGRYLGTYLAMPGSGYETGPGVIGLCWSRDLRHWEIEPPCLLPQNGTECEKAGLYKACLVEYRGLYHIFYNAKNRARGWREQIGVATSRDLKTWVRNPASPIPQNGPAGSFDERFASDPCVLKYKNEWAVFYCGLDRKGVARDLLALSRDMVHVRKCEGSPIAPGPKKTVDSIDAHKPSIIIHWGTMYHFYCAVSHEYGRGISAAASRPGQRSVRATGKRSNVPRRLSIHSEN
ncbi:MAG TPA: hypothetical protein VFC10_04530 [Terriglobia bacterium]|nr:hypothetical protein [Terriglobia bacterium]